MWNDRDYDGMFIGLGLLEGGELAVEQRRRHEVAVAGREPPRDEVAVAFQKDDADRAATGENIAIGALERRAGDDAVVAGVTGCIDPGGDAVEPGPAVF